MVRMERCSIYNLLIFLYLSFFNLVLQIVENVIKYEHVCYIYC